MDEKKISPPKLVSKIPDWCRKNKLTRDGWLSLCIGTRGKIEGSRLSDDTIKRAYNGYTGFSLRTVQTLATVMKVESVSDVVDFA